MCVWSVLNLEVGDSIFGDENIHVRTVTTQIRTIHQLRSIEQCCWYLWEIQFESSKVNCSDSVAWFGCTSENRRVFWPKGFLFLSFQRPLAGSSSYIPFASFHLYKFLVWYVPRYTRVAVIHKLCAPCNNNKWQANNLLCVLCDLHEFTSIHALWPWYMSLMLMASCFTSRHRIQSILSCQKRFSSLARSKIRVALFLCPRDTL